MLLIACEPNQPADKLTTRAAQPTIDTPAPPPTTPPLALNTWQAAQIDWRQFSGTTLTVLGDAQGVFQSLRPLLPAFEQLTGIQVGLILIQQEEMRKKTAHRSVQRRWHL
jgi:multiple sugar transport system substrate-binding protein